tara:strand:- start:14 stop:409 length:396 start_codon:yes stop_codon:yes gene_type:complete
MTEKKSRLLLEKLENLTLHDLINEPNDLHEEVVFQLWIEEEIDQEVEAFTDSDYFFNGKLMVNKHSIVSILQSLLAMQPENLSKKNQQEFLIKMRVNLLENLKDYYQRTIEELLEEIYQERISEIRWEAIS